MFNGAVREIKKEPHTPRLTEMFLEIRQQLEVVELTLSLLLTLVRLSLRNPSDQFYANVGLSIHLCFAAVFSVPLCHSPPPAMSQGPFQQKCPRLTQQTTYHSLDLPGFLGGLMQCRAAQWGLGRRGAPGMEGMAERLGLFWRSPIDFKRTSPWCFQLFLI